MPIPNTDLVKDIENKYNSEKEKLDLVDFESSYRNYKLKEEFQRELSRVDDFNYKLEMLSYTLVILFSVFLILQRIISYLGNEISASLFIINNLIFGYAAFVGYYFLKRKKRRFRRNLIERIENQYQFDENKQQ
jgi:hypothetical protein